MFATCIKFDHSVYSPPDGDPIPMVVAFLDVEGFSDVVKVQLAKKRVEGDPKVGKVFLDFGPKFGSGGKLYWKPTQLRFVEEGQVANG